MIGGLKQQDTDLWEAWIEYDPFHPGNFGILYIIGEIRMEAEGEAVVFERETREETLVLKLAGHSGGRRRRREIFYSEPVRDLNQYSRISIYAGREMVAHFDEIEVMI